jgi:hypothetical protein
MKSGSTVQKFGNLPNDFGINKAGEPWDDMQARTQHPRTFSYTSATFNEKASCGNADGQS